jgi:hypothetical protein
MTFDAYRQAFQAFVQGADLRHVEFDGHVVDMVAGGFAADRSGNVPLEYAPYGGVLIGHTVPPWCSSRNLNTYYLFYLESKRPHKGELGEENKRHYPQRRRHEDFGE